MTLPTMKLNLGTFRDPRTRTRPGILPSSRSVDTRLAVLRFDLTRHNVLTFYKYADLSEFGYGMAILSESKYGFSCLGNVLRISLLRAATAPDAKQDMGKHEFSWAVMPHVGHFLESDVPIAAYLFNSPLHGTCILTENSFILVLMQQP